MSLSPPIVPPPANMLRHLRDDHGVDKTRIRPDWDRQHARLHAAGQADHFHPQAQAPARPDPDVSDLTPPPEDPTTPEEWVLAMSGAQACLLIDAARLYGLVETDVEVDVGRCEYLIAQGRARGYEPPTAEELFG